MNNALCSLTNLKDWLDIANTNSDTTLNRMINAYSRAVLAYIQKPYIYRRTVTKYLDGHIGQKLFLADFPIIKVSSLTIGTTSIPASSGYSVSGYRLEDWDGYAPGRPQELSLEGYSFTKGLKNVAITFDTGYAISDESHVIPATPYQITPTQSQGSWMQDDGITMNGVAMTPVTGTPTTGQYSVSSTGLYTFAAADVGNTVLISYSFVPFDLEQAVIENVAERFRYKSRIGEKSKSLSGQETVSFNLADLTDSVKLVLQPYRRVIL